MITNENEEEARVTFQVYKDYFRFNGGYLQLFLTHLSMILFTVSKFLADYLVGSWTISADQHTRFAYYSSLYFIFTVITSVFVSARCISLLYFTWYGTKKLHE